MSIQALSFPGKALFDDFPSPNEIEWAMWSAWAKYFISFRERSTPQPHFAHAPLALSIISARLVCVSRNRRSAQLLQRERESHTHASVAFAHDTQNAPGSTRMPRIHDTHHLICVFHLAHERTRRKEEMARD